MKVHFSLFSSESTYLVRLLKRENPDNQSIIRVYSYPDPGSNRDGLPHWCLRPARLPIPPSGRISLDCECKGRRFFYICKTLAGFFSYSGIILWKLFDGSGQSGLCHWRCRCPDGAGLVGSRPEVRSGKCSLLKGHRCRACKGYPKVCLPGVCFPVRKWDGKGAGMYHRERRCPERHPGFRCPVGA